LAFCIHGFLANRPKYVRPTGNLNCRLRHSVQIANVVKSAGAEFAANREAEQIGQHGSCFELGPITTTLGGASHSSTPPLP
jgi:hypothetical protein